MKGLNFFKVAGLGLALCLAGRIAAETQPSWALEVLESKRAAFEAVSLHEKDEGWLLTCRMRVKSLNLVPPISQIEFEGWPKQEEATEESTEAVEEEEAEPLWTYSHTIRRKDFEAAYGGGRSQFVRVFLKDVPPGVELVEMSYFKESDEAESEDEESE